MYDILTDMAYEAFKVGDKQLSSELFKEASRYLKMSLRAIYNKRRENNEDR